MGQDRTDLVARLRAAGCVFAEDEAALLSLEGYSAAELEARVSRRVAGEPLEHVLGWAEFAGLRILVDPGVFRPRPRSELLAWEAVARTPSGAVVVDLCCGTGAVAAVVDDRCEVAELHASDLDPAAVACARRNLSASGAHVHCGDLDEPLPERLRGRVDVLVCNAPYVPTDSLALMPAEARDHEAPMALDGGADGLDVLRRMMTIAPGWLAPGGWFLCETSTAQTGQAVAELALRGFATEVVTSEELEATVLVAHLQA